MDFNRQINTMWKKEKKKNLAHHIFIYLVVIGWGSNHRQSQNWKYEGPKFTETCCCLSLKKNVNSGVKCQTVKITKDQTTKCYFVGLNALHIQT